MGFAGHVPCPECHGVVNHKFSCSNAAAVAEWSGSGNHYTNFRSSGNVGALYYKGLPSYFDTDLVSHVEGNLYQGGCQTGVELGDDFQTVVSLYPWGRYMLNEGTFRHEFTMYDSEDGVAFEDLVKASDEVLNGLAKGDKVLVHCQAGLNRSGLVTAFTLMRMGRSAQDAIDLLRRSRSPMVLCNDTFVKQLHELQHRFEDDEKFYSDYHVEVSNES